MKWVHTYDPYGTHQPVLYETILETEGIYHGPIVELGCGNCSTELIHSIAKHRTVYSIENDEDWLNKFKHLATHNRRFILVKDWDDILRMFSDETDISVLFVDQGSWQSRADCLKFFSNRAKIVVVHDSDYLENNNLIRFSDFYKFHKTFMPLTPYPYQTGPPTTILSNVVNVNEWDINYSNYL